jgi:hypothetical protein
MQIEAQVVRSKSELVKELQRLPVKSALIYLNVDRRTWDQIAREHQRARVVVVVRRYLGNCATLQAAVRTNVQEDVIDINKRTDKSFPWTSRPSLSPSPSALLRSMP